MMRAPRPRRDLPFAPKALPFRRRLPLADEARHIDRAWRPVYAVWEITLQCDLACRHCGSRAGQSRPDELSTAEALDLVRQMAELEVKEVAIIGGEAGNIRDNSLRDIWERSKPLRFTRDRTVDALWGFCRTCYYADQCFAGCTWTTDVLFGRPGNNPYCHHRVLELARAGKRERLVKIADAPGRPFDNARFEIVEEDVPANSAPFQEK